MNNKIIIPRSTSSLIRRGEFTYSPTYMKNYERYTFRLFARLKNNYEFTRDIDETIMDANNISSWAKENGAFSEVGEKDWAWCNVSENKWIRLPFVMIGITDPVSFALEKKMDTDAEPDEITVNGLPIMEHTRLTLQGQRPDGLSEENEIGYFRADHDRYRWHYTWWETNANLKTNDVKKEIDRIGTEVIFRTFPGGISSMYYYCYEIAMKTGKEEYYMFYEGDLCLYSIRMKLLRGDYNLYLHCYKK